ncbi:MAG: IgGFc-binding protein, partial [Ignavibacteriota bacterium]
MKRKFALSYLVVLVLGCFAPIGTLRAQTDTRGTDFWVCFPQNAKEEFTSGLNFKLFITGDARASGSVQIPGKLPIPFLAKAGEVVSIDIDTSMQIVGSDKIRKLGIHVISDVPVAVYGLSNRKASSDTYVAFPTNVLGISYRALCYDVLSGPTGKDETFTSQMTVVATEDNTIVTSTPTSNTKGGRLGGVSFNVTLQQGEVYQMQGAIAGSFNGDLTGTLVTSTKPIAFFTGHICAQVPQKVNFCDQLLEEVPPLNTWGKQFLVGKLNGKDWFTIRVVANEDSTRVFVNGSFVKILGPGEFYEADELRENVLVSSDKPILVGEIATSSDADSVKIGDPFLMLITPTEQFLSSYRFATPVRGTWKNFVNIVVPQNSIESLRLNSKAISPQSFSPLGITRYAIAQIEIPYGSHTITCDRAFGLYSYGFGVGGDNYDSYGNSAGQQVRPMVRSSDTSRPTLEIAHSDSTTDLILIARDDRINDLGLSTIQITDSANVSNPITYPKFDIGAPILRFSVRRSELTSCFYIKLRDFAKNESNFALCPASPNSSRSANEVLVYNITPILVQQVVPHEVYPIEIFPSPAKYGQLVNINFTNAIPETIGVEILDEGGNVVTMLQKRELTGSGKHSLIYQSGKYPSGNFFLRF